ncbi:IBR finger domain-containing protein [Diaporthe helianthi]|uniref:RBR-type E3 ubiquitin transferase n=1 Tax=Diaporthe helianthi TaxID=158607 RepID=A0A2P5HN28_DIAHE|nr:IBR finger domain-containing protein [Diaporthe helianthi]
MDISLDHLDLGTRKIVIAILRSDAKEDMAETTRQGDRRAYDTKVALDTYLADLEAQTVLAADRTMAQSMVQAVHRDESIIAAAVAQENQAESDRKAALQFHQTGRLPPHTQAKPSGHDQNPSIDDERRAQLEEEYNLRLQDDNEDDDHTYSRRPQKVRSCASCLEKVQFHDLIQLPCSHEYCRGCLKHLFTACLTDEGLYPPRCYNQTIPETETQVQRFLGGELLGKFLARKLEMETPNKTYCYKLECSAFIPPQGIKGDIAACPKCQAKTCSICKAPAHEGTDCPDDESAQQLLQMAKKEGWKQCYACHKVVELSYGCNHISCRCGAGFCYVCGQPRKETGQPGKCNCPLFDEAELARQAEQQAVAQNQGFHQQPLVRQAQIIQQQRQVIVQNYACQHSRWAFKRGYYRCTECRSKMTGFIFECKQCHIRACAQCKRNRL